MWILTSFSAIAKRVRVWWQVRWFVPTFILPALSLYTIFVILPVIISAGYSFFHWDGMGPMDWVGLDNFIALFRGDRFSQQFLHAFINTLKLFLGLYVLLLPGLAFALVLHSRIHGTGFYKVVIFLPVMIAPIATGFLWRLMLDPNLGAVNWLLRKVGLEALALPWLGSPPIAIWLVTALITWRWTGFNALVFLANLQAIPHEIEEAAAIDGANYWQRLLYIIFPQLTPAITILTILTWTGTFQTFDPVVGLFGIDAGDFHMADVVQTFAIRTTFGISYGQSLVPQFGQGAAIISVVAVLVLLVSIFQVIYISRRER